MRRILYIVSTLKRTGPTNVLFNLISALDRSRFKPFIITLSKEDSKFPSLLNSFEQNGVEVYCLNLSRFSGFLFARKKLRQFIDQSDINVIHILGFRGDILISAKDFEKQVVVSTLLSNIYDDYTMLYGKTKGAIMAWLQMRSLKKKVAIGCSGFVVEELKKKYNVDLKLINNAIPKDHYTVATIAEKAVMRKNLGLPLEGSIYIFVGYLIYRKDPLTTINGFLKSSHANDATLVIIGDGPLMTACKESVGESNRIVFLGNKPETLPYLTASDYYIASSYSEGLPISVMEAMGCGLPVILSDIYPHKELVQSIDNWDYMFKTNDEKGLARCINNISEDSYSVLSGKCRDVIDHKINSKIMAENYQRFYNTCEL